MIRCWGQPKYGIDKVKLIGYELFIREQSEENGEWIVPYDFSRFSPKFVTDLLDKTIATFPRDLEILSFNLDQKQFVDLTYIKLIKDVQTRSSAKIYIELTERSGKGDTKIDTTKIVLAAKAYYDAGISVCIDDVGTGSNQVELINLLDPYVMEYKFALQNVRDKYSVQEINTEVEFWRDVATRHHKYFALEGFEKYEDVAFIERFHPDIVQGYFFGVPHIMPIAADFRLNKEV